MTNREALISALKNEFEVTEDYNRNIEIICKNLYCPYAYGDKRNCIHKDEKVNCDDCIQEWLDNDID